MLLMQTTYLSTRNAEFLRGQYRLCPFFRFFTKKPLVVVTSPTIHSRLATTVSQMRSYSLSPTR